MWFRSVGWLISLSLLSCADAGSLDNEAGGQPDAMPEASIQAAREPSPAKEPTTPSGRLARIEKVRAACVEGAGSRSTQVACDWTAIESAFSILPGRATNQKLRELFLELEEPFMHELTGGEEALSARVMASAAFADLAQARAAILTRSEGMPDVPVGSISPSKQLGWMDDSSKAIRLWAEVRSEDCADYPVPNCSERLDASFSDLIDRPVAQNAAILNE